LKQTFEDNFDVAQGSNFNEAISWYLATAKISKWN